MNAFWNLLIVALAGALLPVPAAAAGLPPDVQWKDPSEVQLKVEFPGQGYTAEWHLFRCECGDLLVRSELNEPGEAVQGDIVMVANRAVLVRGLGKDAAELLSIDAPALMMQLALRLLERAEPAGPAAITERRQLDIDEPADSIQLDSGVAVGGFPAPWSLTGTLQPLGETARRFDLAFEFNTGGVAGVESQRSRMRLAGDAEFARRPFPLDDTQELRGWTLSWRDERDPLAKSEGPPPTLAELRRLIRETPR